MKPWRRGWKDRERQRHGLSQKMSHSQDRVHICRSLTVMQRSTSDGSGTSAVSLESLPSFFSCCFIIWPSVLREGERQREHWKSAENTLQCDTVVNQPIVLREYNKAKGQTDLKKPTVNTPHFYQSKNLKLVLPWPKKLRQPRKPNIGACMLERSRACATCARLSQLFWPGQYFTFCILSAPMNHVCSHPRQNYDQITVSKTSFSSRFGVRTCVCVASWNLLWTSILVVANCYTATLVATNSAVCLDLLSYRLL